MAKRKYKPRPGYFERLFTRITVFNKERSLVERVAVLEGVVSVLAARLGETIDDAERRAKLFRDVAEIVFQPSDFLLELAPPPAPAPKPRLVKS
jgi:hypothetical protein